MEEKIYKPMLAPNKQPELEEINYPILASYKLDGIRCIFYKGLILSRSLKQIQNKQLRQKFEKLREFSEINNCILDGEIYSKELTFQEIVSFVMTKDLEDKKSIKKFSKVMEIPEHLKFYCFDIIKDDIFDKPFSKRQEELFSISKFFEAVMVKLSHREIYSKEILEEEFENAINDDYEGLILRSKDGKYKCGRGTLKEGLIYKIKPFRTFDAIIKGVVQATKVDPEAEKTTNELGRSVTSKKKDDRILIEKASAFVVEYEGKDLKVVIALTDEEKEFIWYNQQNFIGRWIEYKGMLVGAKDVPRHPVFVRYREDKDDNKTRVYI